MFSAACCFRTQLEHNYMKAIAVQSDRVPPTPAPKRKRVDTPQSQEKFAARNKRFTGEHDFKQ